MDANNNILSAQSLTVNVHADESSPPTQGESAELLQPEIPTVPGTETSIVTAPADEIDHSDNSSQAEPFGSAIIENMATEVDSTQPEKDDIPLLEDFLTLNDVVPSIAALSWANPDEGNDKFGEQENASKSYKNDVREILLDGRQMLASKVEQASDYFQGIKSNPIFIQSLDALGEEMDHDRKEIQQLEIMSKSLSFASASLIAGLLLRGSALSASMFFVLPVWRSIDPVAVINSSAKERDLNQLEDEPTDDAMDDLHLKKLEAMFAQAQSKKSVGDRES